MCTAEWDIELELVHVRSRQKGGKTVTLFLNHGNKLKMLSKLYHTNNNESTYQYLFINYQFNHKLILLLSVGELASPDILDMLFRLLSLNLLLIFLISFSRS